MLARTIKRQTDSIIRQTKLDPSQGTSVISTGDGGSGPSGPTVVNPAQDLAKHKAGGDHDHRYYTRSQADGRYAPKEGVGYVFRQLFASVDTIIVPHNLGRYPLVQVVGADPGGYGLNAYGGDQYGGVHTTTTIPPVSVVHDSLNQVTVVLTEIKSGEVICVG